MKSHQPALNVVHFTTNIGGGAGRAAFEIHRGVAAAGCHSCMVVAHNQSGDPTILSGSGEGLLARTRRVLRRKRREWALHRLKPKEVFFLDRLGLVNVPQLKLPFQPDIIHLHWISQFFTNQDLWALWSRYQVPVVWTVMDMAPLTGGCHYTHGCDGYTRECGSCPLINSKDSEDITRACWRAKNRLLRQIPITFVGATDWVIDRVHRSSLFNASPVLKIPYGIDTESFNLRDRKAARKELGLPENMQAIFFGAQIHADERKGLRYLIEALGHLHKTIGLGTPPIMVLIAGESNNEQMRQIPFPAFQLGYLHGNKALAKAYQAADVYVCPSIDDAGPLMMLEALMCGTPVVAFSVCGGVPDYLRPQRNGYVVERQDAKDLAAGIAEVLQAVATGGITGQTCRETVIPACTPAAQASSYVALYQQLCRPAAGSLPFTTQET